MSQQPPPDLAKPTDGSAKERLDWVGPAKVLALLGILLNHLVEEFGRGPWFTNPSDDWPDLATRMATVFPTETAFPFSLVQFLGWLGDSGPGVFILLSGLGLTWAALQRGQERIDTGEFFRRRALRIFPLYMAMHFLMLAGSILVPGSDLTFASADTLLSLIGLRCTDQLFFYITPAWWFFWLILQLYLVFPLLYYVLRRRGVVLFLVVAVTLTIASRGLGLLGIRYNESLYFWMTGIFFGTRLAEFAAGMALAVVIADVHRGKRRPASTPTTLMGAGGLYIVGFACSLTWPGTLVSNLLVTLGLTGLFYAGWEYVLKRIPRAAGVFAWLEIETYGVYLIHQPLLKLALVVAGGAPLLLLSAGLLVLAASVPAALLVRRSVDRLLSAVESTRNQTGRGSSAVRLVFALAALDGCLLLWFAEPLLDPGWERQVFALVLAGLAAVSCAAERMWGSRQIFLERFLHWSMILSALMFAFNHDGPVVALTALVIGFVAAAAYSFVLRSRVFALATAGVFLLAAEFLLWYGAPIETASWGEYPALMEHPTRVYALKPNLETRLRYNNYDYVLHTNSLGLASPEIPLKRPSPDTFRVLVLGDAFAMPEGVEYEDSFPALLEKRLQAALSPRPVQVINAGVTGYGPVETSAQYAELAPLYRPDVTVYEFFVNEFEEVSISRDSRLESIGLVRKASRLKTLAMHSQVRARLTRIARSAQARFAGSTSSYCYWKALLGLYRADQNRYYRGKTIEKVRTYLLKMQDTADSLGSDFLVLFVPGAIAVSRPEHVAYYPWNEDLHDPTKYDLTRPLRALTRITSGLNLPVLDLTQPLKQHAEQPVYFPESWHWNREGHRVVAATIADHLVGEGSSDRARRAGLDSRVSRPASVLP